MSATRSGPSADKYKLLSATLKRAGMMRQEGIPRRGPEAVLPLSFAQERLWFLDQLEPGNPQYNIFIGARLLGPLDVAAFERTVHEIVRRHEALRTILPAVDGSPVQVILPEIDELVEVVDLGDLEPPAREARAQECADWEADRPFDLAAGPLIRVTLLRLSDAEHWLLVTVHHTVFDGWSIGLFCTELATLYKAFAGGQPSPLSELPVQYADFAIWQRQRLQGSVLQEQIGYWKHKIAGAPELLQLPTDYPRPAVQRFRGRSETFVVPAALADSLNDLARTKGTTLFVVLMSIFQILLFRYAGQEDMLVAAGVGSRNRREIEQVIGCFINILLLRADLAGDPTVLELLGRVHETTLDAHAHQDVSFEQIVAAIRPQRDLSHLPLFQVMMVLQNAALPTAGFHDITFSGIRVPERMSAQCDLLVLFLEGRTGIAGRIEYNSDLFSAATIVRMVDHLKTLLQSAVDHPSRRISALSVMAADERRQVVRVNNRTAWAFPRERCLHELFEAEAERDPGAIAVIVNERRLSYGDLNAHANALAHRLRASGVGPESVVAICLRRSVEWVIALMATLKAGGAYLPLDPDYPSNRLSFMLDDSGASVLLTQPELLEPLASRPPIVFLVEHDWNGVPDRRVANPRSGVTPENLAYLIYTSGSTGRAKGALLDHRGRVNNFCDFNDQFGVGPGDRLIALSSPSFDMSAYDVFGTLAAGAAIVLPDESGARDPLYWAELMNRERVSVWHSVPAFLELLVDGQETSSSASSLPALRLVLLGGDWIPVTLPDRLRAIAPRAQVVSMGGATEVSMDSTIYPIGATDPSWTSIPYGRPMRNQLAYVVDAHFDAVPIGVCGELCLGGIGVGRGYHRRPDLTAARFIPHPFSEQPGDRVYRTGDLARWREDGVLELIGRIDNQVKVRGFRIELGEVKAALERHPAIREAEVLMIGGKDEAKKLAGYIVPAAATSDAEIKEHLRSTLPEYMVPSAFVRLDALPLSPNGKVDRRALPAPEPTVQAFRAPRTRNETVLAGLCAEVLRLEQVSTGDNFFDLGGDSVSSIKLVNRAQKAGLALTVKDIFQYQTVEALAAIAGSTKTESVPVLDSVAVLDDWAAALRRDARTLAREAELPAGSNILPLASGVEELLDQSARDGSLAVPFVQTAVTIPFRLVRAPVERAFALLAERNPLLRTSFGTINGTGFQAVHPDAEVPVRWEDWRTWSDAERDGRLDAIIRQHAIDGIDGSSPVVLRVFIGTIADDRHRMLLTFNYCAIDGWSLNLLLEEWAQIYTALVRDAAVPPNRRPAYGDYLAWLRARDLRPLETLWTKELADADLPTPLVGRSDRRPAADGAVAKQHIVLDAEMTRQIRQLARQSGCTENIVFQCAWGLVLADWTARHDVVFGVAFTGRTVDFPDIVNLTGFTLNFLPVRMRCDPESGFVDLLRSVSETQQRLMAHEYVSLRDIRRWCGLPEASPLFESVLYFQNLSGILNRQVGTFQIDVPYPLRIDVFPGSDDVGTSIHASYRTACFAPAEVGAVLDRYRACLAAGIQACGRQSASSVVIRCDMS